MENVNTSDKETQIDHVSMLKEYDLIRYQQQHPDQYRPYGNFSSQTIFQKLNFDFFLFSVEVQRIRKDSETLSNSGYSTVSRNRRESERLRGEFLATENLVGPTQRSLSNPAPIREVKL